MKKTIIIDDISELLLLDRLLDRWKVNARRTDTDYGTGYALHGRVREALTEKLKEKM